MADLFDQIALEDLIGRASLINKKLSTKQGLIDYGINVNDLGSIDPDLVKSKLLTDLGLLNQPILSEAQPRFDEGSPPIETYQDVMNKKLDTLLGKKQFEDINTTYNKALERIGSADETEYSSKEEADKAGKQTETLAFLDAIAQQGDKTVQQSLISPIGQGKALYNILKDTYRDVTSSEDPNKISVADLIAGKRPPEPASNTLADYARYTGGTLAGMLGDTTQAIRSIPGFKSVEPYLLGPDVDKSLSEVEGYREMANLSKQRLSDRGLSTSLFEAPDVPVVGPKSAALDTLLQNIEGLGDVGNIAAMGGAALAGPAAGGALATGLFAPPMIKHEGELLSKLLPSVINAVPEALAGKGSEEETARDLTQLGINTLMLGLMGAGAKAELKGLKNKYTEFKIDDLLKKRAGQETLGESFKGPVETIGSGDGLGMMEAWSAGSALDPLSRQSILQSSKSKPLSQGIGYDPRSLLLKEETMGPVVVGPEGLIIESKIGEAPKIESKKIETPVDSEVKSFKDSLISKLKDEGGWIDPFGRGKKENLGREDAEYIAPSSSEVGGASLLSERSYEDYFKPAEISPEVLDGFKKVTLDMPITELNKPVKQRAVEAAFNEFADMMKEAKRTSPEKLQKQGVTDLKAELKTLPKTDQANLMQDIGATASHFKPIKEMIDRVAENDPLMRDALTTKLDTQTTDAVASMMTEIKDNKSFLEKVKKDVKANSEMDAAIKGYGEKIISEDQLVNKFGKARAEKIKAYAEEFRRRYDQILKATNEVLTRYGKEPIKYRKDYFTHATEIASFWERLNRDSSSTNLGGLSSSLQRYTTKGLWNRFAKERKTEAPHINSAIIAFDSYLIPTLKQKHLTPVVETFRGVVEGLKTVELETGVSLKNFKSRVSELADIIAGGVHPLDAQVKGYVNPVLWNIYKEGMNRIGKNAIIGNAGVGIAQTLNAPLVAKTVGNINYTKGLAKQFFEQFNGQENFAYKHSNFLKNRYTDISPVVKTIGNKLSDAVSFLPHHFERFLTESAWRGAYEKVKKQNPRMLEKDLFTLADEMTAKMVGDRSIGKKPLAFESDVLQIPLQFQLEVNNVFNRYADLVKTKDIKGLVQLAGYMWAFNSLYESVTGRRPLFDPIQATYEAVTDEERTPMQRVGRVAGEFLNAVPGSSALTMLIPEEKRKKYFGGTEIGMYGDPPALSTIKRILGAKDLQTAGTNALTSIGLPFGGAQVGKTMRGYKLVQDRKEQGSPLDMGKSLKAMILGPNSVRDTSMVDEGKARIYKQSEDTKAEYDQAKKLHKEFKALAKTKGADYVQGLASNLAKTNPTLYDKLVKTANDEAAGFTEVESLMNRLYIDNWARSKFIKEYLDKSFKTDADKNAYVKTLADKGIVNDKILSQLRDLYKKGKKK